MLLQAGGQGGGILDQRAPREVAQEALHEVTATAKSTTTAEATTAACPHRIVHFPKLHQSDLHLPHGQLCNREEEEEEEEEEEQHQEEEEGGKKMTTMTGLAKVVGAKQPAELIAGKGSTESMRVQRSISINTSFKHEITRTVGAIEATGVEEVMEQVEDKETVTKKAGV